MFENLLPWLHGADPRLQAFLAGLFTLGVTALGAATVVFSKRLHKGWLTAMLGFASGVMLAASYWSLLAPAIEMAEQMGGKGWVPAAVGFLAGAGFLRLADALIPHLHPGRGMDRAEGPATAWQRTVLLVLAITLHNIPEGLAVGVAFGAVAAELPGSPTFSAAVALAVGIGLQNFPEGIAVSLPLRGAGVSRLKSFGWGTLSAAVEPVAALAGAAAVMTMRPLLPYALAFAAGAMVYVVVEELIPEAQQHEQTDLATLGTVAGFTLMMILDVALG